MIVWIASSARSGNTFFRIILHQLYGIHTYAAFNASEVLRAAGAEELVGAEELPIALKEAMATRTPEEIRRALEDLDRSRQLYVFKTHAKAHELFGTNFRAILLVRDGRDAIASYAHYLVDLRFDLHAFRHRLGKMKQSRDELLNPQSWTHLAKIMLVAVMKRFGLRRRLVSWRINQLLNQNHRLRSTWRETNQSWLDRERKPVVVYFNDLIHDPIGTVTQAIDKLEIGVVPNPGAPIPTFVELQKKYPSFFRKGTSGDWKNHFSPTQAESFKRYYGAMMKRLNFPLNVLAIAYLFLSDAGSAAAASIG